jgi:hypothetical protein
MDRIVSLNLPVFLQRNRLRWTPFTVRGIDRRYCLAVVGISGIGENLNERTYGWLLCLGRLGVTMSCKRGRDDETSHEDTRFRLAG